MIALLSVSRSSPQAVSSLAPFLPRAGPSTHLYPSTGPGYPGPTLRHGPGSGARSSSRPYSADVGRLLSVAEDAEVPRPASNKSHRRSSSHGSTSEMAAAVRYRDTDLRQGYSYSDIHSDYHTEDDPEYYCE